VETSKRLSASLAFAWTWCPLLLATVILGVVLADRRAPDAVLLAARALYFDGGGLSLGLALAGFLYLPVHSLQMPLTLLV
jgi:hypothetical protein